MTTSKKPRDFTNLSAEEIATLVETDIRSEARKWKREHPLSRGRGTRAERDASAVATSTAALYLQANNVLYMREDR